jgi:hypothetical protein
VCGNQKAALTAEGIRIDRREGQLRELPSVFWKRNGRRL